MENIPQQSPESTQKDPTEESRIRRGIARIEGQKREVRAARCAVRITYEQNELDKAMDGQEDDSTCESLPIESVQLFDDREQILEDIMSKGDSVRKIEQNADMQFVTIAGLAKKYGISTYEAALMYSERISQLATDEHIENILREIDEKGSRERFDKLKSEHMNQTALIIGISERFGISRQDAVKVYTELVKFDSRVD